MTRYRGAVCGLADGMERPGRSRPRVLRGVCLLGIDSVMRWIALAEVAGAPLPMALNVVKLSEITHEISLVAPADGAAA
ncbi:MAG: hypothetical protein NT113_06135 [Hyphomicrobiales bacterium]|nr:hypothetical protein [Hyphomicrobiales bacterium]